MGFDSNTAEGWETIVQPKKTSLSLLLEKFFKSGRAHNIHICIDEHVFNCNLMVLKCYSGFFVEFSVGATVHLPADKVTATAFTMIYRWMLAKKPVVHRKGMVALFNAALFLRVKVLVQQCWMCLNNACFREDSAFLLMMEARRLGAVNLDDLMLPRISKFFITIVASKEFLDMNAKDVCKLLSSSSIAVRSEVEVFMAVVWWLGRDWAERQPWMLRLVKTVRFGLMSPFFLLKLNKSKECVEIGRIICHPEVQEMITDAVCFTSTQMLYEESRDESLKAFVESHQLQAPGQRQWIFEKGCDRHNFVDCPVMQFVNFGCFLQFLEATQAKGVKYWRSLETAEAVRKPMQCCTCCYGLGVGN